MLHGLCFWGGRRSTKPYVFPCKEAASGDDRYVVCAAGAAAVVSCANCSSYVCCKKVVVSVCVIYAVFESLAANCIGMAA